MVDAYGSTAPLSSLGQVVQTNARTLTVNVFDPSVSKAVADAPGASLLSTSLGATQRRGLGQVADMRRRRKKEEDA